MSNRNRPRRQALRPRATAGQPGRLPLRPLQLAAEPKPENGRRGEAELCAFLLRVIGGAVPESVDAEMTAALVAMILKVMTENITIRTGLAPEHGRAAAVGWLLARAAMPGPAAVTRDAPQRAGDALAMPSPDEMQAAAAAYAGDVMDGQVPLSCPAWIPAALASMLRSSMVAAFVSADGLDREAAISATRGKLAEMAEGAR